MCHTNGHSNTHQKGGIMRTFTLLAPLLLSVVSVLVLYSLDFF